MRRILSVFVAMLLLLNASAALCELAALDPESLVSQACILIDAYTGEVLFEKDADSKRSPASITKIMTLLIAINKSDPDEIVTVPACVEDIGLNSSRVPVYFGEEMPMRDLWYGLIFKSGNDAANAIAELVSGSVDGFVDEMNEWAQKLEMTDTHFANPHGYTQEGHYTTARDMAKLTQYALDNDLFREITFSKEYTMKATSLRGEYAIAHKYDITEPASPEYYQYARGIKTGYTADAGQCYVGAAQKNGRELIVVLMKCGWTKPEKWTDARRLLIYGFDKLEETDENFTLR